MLKHSYLDSSNTVDDVTFVQSKLSWLKQELREFRDKENKLKSSMKDMVLSSEIDRQQLMAELERQSEVLEQLAYHRPSEYYVTSLPQNHRRECN